MKSPFSECSFPLVDTLVEAWKSGNIVVPDDAFLPKDEAAAEAMQDAMLHQLGEVAGWKLGASVLAVRKKLGLSRIFVGALPKDRVLRSGDEIAGLSRESVAVESEYAFYFAKNLPPASTPIAHDDVRAAVSRVHAAIEIPYSRFEAIGAHGGHALIADNGAAGWIVIGEGVPLEEVRDFSSAAVTLQVAGSLAATGNAARIEGMPFDLLTEFVRLVHSRGHAVSAGQYVLLGNCTTSVRVPLGSFVSVEIAGIGSVHARLGASPSRSAVEIRGDSLAPSKVAVLSRSFSRNALLRAELQKCYPDAKFNDTGRTLAGQELVAFVSGYDGVITALETIDEIALSKMPDLKVLSKYGVGLDNIDLSALNRRGIRIGWTGGVNRNSVAELTIGMMLALFHLVPELNCEVRSGRWGQRLGRELTGRTVGILGCGHVGKSVIQLLRGFRCRILAHDMRDLTEFYAENDVRAVDLHTLFRSSEVVTIHLPVTASTRHLVNADILDLMPPRAVIVNAARGGIIDEIALKECLKNGKLAGAALDVFEIEPPADPELIALPNLLATPHIGGSSEEAVLAMGRAAIDGLFEARDPLEPGHIPEWCR